MTKSSKDKYTDSDLRDKIKEEVQAGDKGGEPGQWSARKAQMMAKQYKEEGGGYKTDKKDDQAKHLDQWTKEEWQTKDGDGSAKSEEGMHRYLPKKAWEKMTDKEKEDTDEQKLEGSRAGDQYVENTPKAKKARKEVSEEPEEEESANHGSSKKRKTNANDDSLRNDKQEETEGSKDNRQKKAQSTDDDEEQEEAVESAEEEDDAETPIEIEDEKEDDTADLAEDDDDAEFKPDE